MKRWLVAVIVAALLLPWLPARARAETVTIKASGTCGESAYWKLTSDRVLTVFGSGAMKDYTVSNASFTYNIRDQFDSIVVENGITHLSSNFVYYKKSDFSISLPDSLVSIGDSAFESCGFSSISLPSNLVDIGRAVFLYCSNLTSIDLPSGIQSLGSSCFEGSGLTSITIPASLLTIGSSCFYSCTSLDTVNVLAAVPPSLTGSLTQPRLFQGCLDTLRIYVPDVAAYESAVGWSDYAAWIVGGYTSGGGAGSAGGSTGGGVEDTDKHLYTLSIYPEAKDKYYLGSQVQFYADFTIDGVKHDIPLDWSTNEPNNHSIDSNGLLTIADDPKYANAIIFCRPAASSGYSLDFCGSLTATYEIYLTFMTEEEANKPTVPDDDSAVLGAISNLDQNVDQLQDSMETLPNQITGGMSDLMDQQEQEAQSEGEAAIGEIVDIIPDESQAFLSALGVLADALGYTGTDAVLKSPVIKIPAVGSLFPETVLLESQDIDFGVWFNKMPNSIMQLVRALFDLAIVYFCAKEFLSLVGGFINGFVGFDDGLEGYNE